MRIIYQIKFSDDTFYIGQTDNLNRRVDEHKRLWKSTHGIKIVNIKILDFANSRSEALRIETAYIKASDTLKLRNTAEMDARAIKTHILEPTELIHHIDGKADTDKKRILKKQVDRLEKRYLKTWMELEKMKDNIKYIDVIVDQAIQEAMRRD